MAVAFRMYWLRQTRLRRQGQRARLRRHWRETAGWGGDAGPRRGARSRGIPAWSGPIDADTPGDEGASPPQSLLFRIFDELEGNEQESLPDGRPKVDSVRERLRALGQPNEIGRAEIDEAYQAWQEQES